MARHEHTTTTAGKASMVVVDTFVAGLRDLTIQELALSYRALRSHFDMMNLLGKAAGTGAGEAAFDILQQENDSRLEAVRDELQVRQPDDEPEAHARRGALLDYAAWGG